MGRSKAEKAKAHKRIVAIIRGLTASLASRMVINVPDDLTIGTYIIRDLAKLSARARQSEFARENFLAQAFRR